MLIGGERPSLANGDSESVMPPPARLAEDAMDPMRFVLMSSLANCFRLRFLREIPDFSLAGDFSLDLTEVDKIEEESSSSLAFELFLRFSSSKRRLTSRSFSCFLFSSSSACLFRFRACRVLPPGKGLLVPVLPVEVVVVDL